GYTRGTNDKCRTWNEILYIGAARERLPTTTSFEQPQRSFRNEESLVRCRRGRGRRRRYLDDLRAARGRREQLPVRDGDAGGRDRDRLLYRQPPGHADGGSRNAGLRPDRGDLRRLQRPREEGAAPRPNRSHPAAAGDPLGRSESRTEPGGAGAGATGAGAQPTSAGKAADHRAGMEQIGRATCSGRV